jgi:methylthioxylose transferase
MSATRVHAPAGGDVAAEPRAVQARGAGGGPAVVGASVARAALPVIAWAALILAARAIGRPLYVRDPREHVGNAPLVGSLDWHPSTRLLAAVALGAAAVWVGPRLARRLSFGALLAAAWAAGAAWAVTLAAGDGLDAVAAPLRSRYEYLAAVPRVHEPVAFLHGFVGHLTTYPTHVKGHPPGLLLGLAGLRSLGLDGAAAAAVAVIAIGAAAGPLALVALRALRDERAARAAAPFVAVAPAAVWIGTSADALFAGVGAAAVALFALATRERPGISAIAGSAGRLARPVGGRALAFAAGAVFGVALMLTYGAAPLAVLLVAIAIRAGRLRLLALAALGALAVLGAFALAGFAWWDGLRATHHLYASGVAARRPYAAFMLIDLAAFAVALGPATAAGLARLRSPAVWTLVAGALVAVAVADLSGFSRGETERIWLPFAPWLLLAAGALPRARAWLGAQVALALALQAGVHTPW